VADDDRALMERLAALEAEVKGDADAQRARKEAAMQRVREQRAAQQAERDELRARQAAIVKREKPPQRAAPEEDDVAEDGDDDDGPITTMKALELAKRAGRVKNELTKPRKKGQKSYLWSGGLSFLLGPIGWLYAGSWREAAPFAAAEIIIAWLAHFLPSLILMPALMFLMPASAIAGLLYAYGYNKHGGRQRLFGDDKPKQLKGG
jgi:hypothetical protein